MEKFGASSPSELPSDAMTVAKAQSILEGLSDKDGQELLNSYRREAVGEWTRINNSFAGLFDRLNLFNVRELTTFDLVTSIDEDGTENYLRTWRDERGYYGTADLVRRDGKIVARENQSLHSDTYEYRFGPDESLVATVKIRDEILPASAIAREDSNGNLHAERSLYESAVLVSAFENAVLPQLKTTSQTLQRLWQTVQSIEFNN